jgi:thiol:disulfide interchange protein
MKKRSFLLGLLAIPLLSIAAPAAENSGIQWTGSLQEVNEKAKSSGKLIMVDFYTDW